MRLNENQLRTFEATKCNFPERVTFCGFKVLGTADKDHELLSSAPEPDGHCGEIAFSSHKVLICITFLSVPKSIEVRRPALIMFKLSSIFSESSHTAA